MDCKEIKEGSVLREKLRAGVNKLADVVTKTLGPNGSTIIIADGYGEPYITKDGVSVSNYVTLSDPIENIAATLLKQVAKNTVELAGDGTTTSIALAQSFINKGFDLLDRGSSYNKLKERLEGLEGKIIAQLIANSKELDKSNIVDVATISSNNDTKIAALIQEAYNHSDIVKVVEANSLEDKLTTISGMELDTGMFDSAFLNNGETQSADYDDPVVIIIDGKVTKLDNIAQLLYKLKDKPIVIVAEHFNEEVVSVLKDNYNKGALKVVLVKSPGFAGHRKNLLSDIAMYAGTTVLSPTTKYNDIGILGELKNVHIGKHNCILSNEMNSIAIGKHIEELQVYLDSLPKSSQEISLLTQRIENLTGKVAIIEVGGKSEVEMKERKDRIDDAVLAVQCALEEGIVEGGGYALVRSIMAIDDKHPFAECLTIPFRTIFKEEEIAVFNTDRDMFKENIIDPLKVTRVALQNAISVAKTILGTDAVVLNERLWN